MSDPSKVSLARSKAPLLHSMLHILWPAGKPLASMVRIFTSCTNHSHIAGLFISTSCFACTFHFLVHSISWSNPVQQLSTFSSTSGPHISSLLGQEIWSDSEDFSLQLSAPARKVEGWNFSRRISVHIKFRPCPTSGNFLFN